MIIKIYEQIIQLDDVYSIGHVDKESMSFYMHIEGIDPIEIGLDEADVKKNLIDYNKSEYIDRENLRDMSLELIKQMRYEIVNLWNETRRFVEIKPAFSDVRKNSHLKEDSLPWTIQYQDGKILDKEYHLSINAEHGPVGTKIPGKVTITYRDLWDKEILGALYVVSETKKSAIEIMKTFLKKNKYQSYIQKYELYDKD